MASPRKPHKFVLYPSLRKYGRPIASLAFMKTNYGGRFMQPAIGISTLAAQNDALHRPAPLNLGQNSLQRYQVATPVAEAAALPVLPNIRQTQAAKPRTMETEKPVGNLQGNIHVPASPAVFGKKKRQVVLYRHLPAQLNIGTGANSNLPDLMIPSTELPTSDAIVVAKKQSNNTISGDGEDLLAKLSRAIPHPPDKRPFPLALGQPQKLTVPPAAKKEEDRVKCYAIKTRLGKVPGKPNKVNQDSYIAIRDLMNIRGSYFFGILDGHGTFGREASDLAKKRLPCTISRAVM